MYIVVMCCICHVCVFTLFFLCYLLLFFLIWFCCVCCLVLFCFRWLYLGLFVFFFFKRKPAYEMRISDWSSDVCSSDLLREDLVDGAFAALAADGLGDIRDPAAFAARRDDIGKALFGEAMARLQQAETILGLVADVRVKLDSTLVGWARGNLDDMQAQLAALVPPGFLRAVPASVLAEYPLYLKALAPRAPRALPAPDRKSTVQGKSVSVLVDY